jgi:hypothetical protein
MYLCFWRVGIDIPSLQVWEYMCEKETNEDLENGKLSSKRKTLFGWSRHCKKLKMGRKQLKVKE